MDKGYKIKILRESKGISQKQVALSLNISQSAYSKMEACEERISVENCKKIAEIIGVGVADIFEFDSRYQFADKKLLSELSELSEKHQKLLKELEDTRVDNRILLRLLDTMREQKTVLQKLGEF